MFVRVMRYSPPEKMLRLFRIIWETPEAWEGDFCTGGYSNKLSVGLQRKLFYFDSSFDGWRLTILGFHISHRRSFGGRFV